MDFNTLFRNNCQGCHGVDGRGGPARILNDPLYLAILPREELYNVIENGRPGTAMPAWSLKNGGPFSEKQIHAVVDGIENNWAKPAEFRGVKLPSYYQPKNGGDVMAGQKTFVRDCYMCHGPGAAIGSVTDAAFLSLITDQCLRTSIIAGRPDFSVPMPDYRHLNLGRALSEDDIANLVAYLSAKRPPEVTAMYENARTSKPQETTRGNASEQQAGSEGQTVQPSHGKNLSPGQQTGATGTHENENGSEQNGPTTKGNEGSGTGPGSPRKQKGDSNKSTKGGSH